MERSYKVYSDEDIYMEYSVIGEGKPIFVLHGGHSNCKEEFGYKALIENGYSIITPSRPGYGRTSKEIGASLETASTYYAKLLSDLKIDKVHVIAISAGGPSGIFFASKYPDLVSTLTLQSAVTKQWLTTKDKEYKAAKILFHPKTEKYTWNLISFMNNRQRSGEGFFIDLDQVNTLLTKDLERITCPTFIMHSKHDGSVPLEHAQHAHENIPSSELCLLDAWGHLIWLGESADVTDEKLIDFLERSKVGERYFT
ncbi:alpha/beta fold hydrolase [Oceanobacillus salinisoli]|uniref:alpha/beta fold hydrolase n=1 Tax=Oceanobacillus salinisoli TaxID=2678611 RepID=UPI0038B29DFC